MRISSRTVALCLALFFTAATYTTNGCGGFESPTDPAFGTVEVRGAVTDATSGVALSGASISVSQGNTSTVTSSDRGGRYTVHVPPGPQLLEATAPGYVKFSTQINVPTTGLVADIRMQRAP